MKSIPFQDLTRRFFFVTAGLILFTAFTSQIFFTRQERTNLETRLREKATFINGYYADAIAESLASKDDVMLLRVANRLEEDQEIFSIVVVDQRGRIRYHRDPEKVGLPTEDTALSNTLKTGEAIISTYVNSGGKAIALLTPLKVQGLSGLLGAVRIDLTHRNIEKQVTSSRKRFWFVILGSLVTCAALITFFVNRWVLYPLNYIHTTLSQVNPAMPEPNFLAAPEEFGRVTSAMNELLFKIKAEMQRELTAQQVRGQQEKEWIRQMANTLLPGARIIIADKDNRLVSDSGESGIETAAPARTHLLDLITDTNFANLVTSAFRKEGEATRGKVTFQEKSYNATILSVPAHQSVTVKTLIALVPDR